ncbi:ABC transporter permease [Streptomyces sp. NBC_00257]|uniref:FtsX-like permease family protein n=1 Tax=unclassified Streptomyces TaxID=2593676 RepID=UPI0022526B07|nr:MULTISPECIES: ABC transporter permease [unclassified Streptomyces]MCX5428369.1 ABC transporter permease [Streptomyces sp. NBC_00062]
MFDIAWSTIKKRKGGFIAAFIAVFCGSAVVTACGVLLMSGLLSGVSPERYAGAAVMIGGNQSREVAQNFDPHYAERVTLPASLTAEVAEVPGVRAVVGDRTVGMSIADRKGRTLSLDHPLFGHGWASAALGPFTLAEGAEPRGEGEAVLDTALAGKAGVKVGDTVRLSVGTTPASYRVVGLAAPSKAGLSRQSAVFLTDARATQLSQRPDRLTAIGVLAEPGTDADALAGRIEKALAGSREPVAVHTGKQVGDLEFLDMGQSRGFLVALSASFGGTALAVVIFVVSSTLGLAVHQRRRELAMLRAIAASPRQIHSLIGSEILMVAAAGALLGAAPGFLIAGALRDAFASVGVLPGDFELSYNPAPAGAAVVLCVLGARLAGFIAAFRTARIQPVEALRESQSEPPRLGRVRLNVGRGLIVLGLAAAVVLPAVIPGQLAIAGAAGSLLILMFGCALIGPQLVKITAAMMAPLLRSFRISGYLAAANTSANSRRLSSAVVPLALGAAMALMQLSTLSTVEATAAKQAATGVVADYVLTSDSTGLSTELADSVRAVPGVATATPVARSQVMLNYLEVDKMAARPFSAEGIDPRGIGRTLDLDVREGSLDALTGDTVALSWMAADTAGLGIGDTADVNLGDGVRKKLKVVAVYGNGLGFGDVTLPHGMLTAHTTDRLDAALLVTASDTGDRDRVGKALAELAQRTPTLKVQQPDEFAAVQQGQFAQQSWTNLIANSLLLLYVLIAVVNTLVIATMARSREFAMLRLIGTSRRQTLRMMFLESWVVVVTAIVVGVLIAVPPTIGSSLAMTGQAMPHVDPLVWAGVGAFIAVLGWLSIALSTRSALRTRPIDAVYTGE